MAESSSGGDSITIPESARPVSARMSPPAAVLNSASSTRGGGGGGGGDSLSASLSCLTPEEESKVDEMISLLRRSQKCRTREEAEVDLPIDDVLMVLLKSKALMLSQPTLLELHAPMNVVGDIHGQFLDLLRFFEEGGFPPDKDYLFLGDYVDRGTMGVECAMLLLCYKLKYPNKVFMLRGNHECTAISRIYGFYEECRRRYSLKTWRMFNDVFDVLPLAAIISDVIFCTHGGLSPELQNVDQIRGVQRPCSVPDDGLVCDLLWSDPDPDVQSFEPSDRGVSWVFGEDVLEDFLADNDFDLFVRAHQVVEDGYEFFPSDKRSLVTIFSAANYCGQFDNAGAMLIVNKDLVCSFHVICPLERKSYNPVAERPGTPGIVN